MTPLLLLNGLPGVGKSTLAEAWAGRHPGTLNLDVDMVRSLISGDGCGTAEPARALALVMAVLAAYTAGLAEVAAAPGVHRLADADVARAVGRLELLVHPAPERGEDAGDESGGSAGTSGVIGR